MALETEQEKDSRLERDRIAILFGELRREFQEAIHKLDIDGTNRSLRDLAHLKDEFESLKTSIQSVDGVAIATASESKHEIEKFKFEFREGIKNMNQRYAEITKGHDDILNRENERIVHGDKVLEDAEKACNQSNSSAEEAKKFLKKTKTIAVACLVIIVLGLVIDRFMPRSSQPSTFLREASIQTELIKRNGEAIQQIMQRLKNTPGTLNADSK